MQAAAANDERVDRRNVGLEQLRDRELVRGRDVRTVEAEGDESAQCVLESFRRHRKRNVRPVERPRREGGVLHQGGERPGDRIAEQADEPGLARDHGPP